MVVPGGLLQPGLNRRFRGDAEIGDLAGGRDGVNRANLPFNVWHRHHQPGPRTPEDHMAAARVGDKAEAVQRAPQLPGRQRLSYVSPLPPASKPRPWRHASPELPPHQPPCSEGEKETDDTARETPEAGCLIGQPILEIPSWRRAGSAARRPARTKPLVVRPEAKTQPRSMISAIFATKRLPTSIASVACSGDTSAPGPVS